VIRLAAQANAISVSNILIEIHKNSAAEITHEMPVVKETEPTSGNNKPIPLPSSRGLSRKALFNDILKELSADPFVTYDELTQRLQASPATVKRRVLKMKEEGLVRRVGSKKTGSWEVLVSPDS
jgi:predicted HTH transcriptional regulator